jgi:hypothetical protein
MLSGSHILTPPSCQQLRLSFLKLLHRIKNSDAYFKYIGQQVPVYKAAVICYFHTAYFYPRKKAAFFGSNDPWEGKPLAGCPRRCSPSKGKLSI